MKRIALVCGLTLLFAAACGSSQKHSDSASAPRPAKSRATLAATPKPTPTPSPKPHKRHRAAAPGRRPHTSWWQPRNVGPNNGAEWQWELDHALTSAAPVIWAAGR